MRRAFGLYSILLLIFTVTIKADEPKSKAEEPKKEFSYKLGGWLQTDYRHYLRSNPNKNSFLIRRARLDVRGTLPNDFAYRLFMEFEGTSARLREGWLEYRKFPCAKFMMGQFKIPFSVEALYSARWIHFVERGLGPSNIAPFQDIGAQLYGELYCDKLKYALAVFNGEGVNTLDLDNSKEGALHLLYQPFKNCDGHLFERVYVEGDVTGGNIDKSIAGHSYRTAGRTTFLSFNPGVYQDGPLVRASSSIEWYKGPFQACVEYLTIKRYGIKISDVEGSVACRSFYVEGSYLLTGETQPRNDAVTPKHPFDPCSCSWGAWEVGARYEEFHTDPEAFDLAIVAGVSRLTAITGGVIWWPNKNLKFMANYVYTDFHGDLTVSGITMSDEQVVLVRGQYNF